MQTTKPFIDPTWTVREVVQRYPSSVTIFKAFKVEACCDAGRQLGDAAERAGITLEILMDALEVGLSSE